MPGASTNPPSTSLVRKSASKKMAGIPLAIWLGIAIILLPIAIVFMALGIKIFWGFWPGIISLVASAYLVWTIGFEWFWLIALGIIAGVLFTWLWQRTTIFLNIDRRLERGMFLGD